MAEEAFLLYTPAHCNTLWLPPFYQDEEASDICCSVGSYLTMDKGSKFTATNILSVLAPLRVPDSAACPHAPGWALARKGSLPLAPCNTVR